MDRRLKEVGALSYISTDVFDGNFWTYTVTNGPAPQFERIGTLVAVAGASPTNCPAGTVLRENGKKLYPGVHGKNVKTYMVGVYCYSGSAETMFSGFINPNDPMFSPYNSDRPYFQPDSVYTSDNLTKNLGSSVYTLGQVTSAGEVVSSGQLRCSTVTALGTTAAETLDVSKGQVFTLSTARSVTITPSNMVAGAQVFLIVTGGGTHTVTFGTNMKGLGTISATVDQVFTLHFICDDTHLYEVSRTAAFTDII